MSEHFRNYNPVDWWLDRMGNMQFIEDQKDGIMQPAFYWEMIRIADKTGFSINTLT